MSERAPRARFAAVHGERLLLLGAQSFAARLDLPLAARPLPAAGVYVGVAGGAACFLQPGPKLATADLATLEPRQFPLDDVTGGLANAPVQAATDGALVYLTGPTGILCVNARTGHKVFAAPWPERAAPKQPPAPTRNAQYLWHGVSAYCTNDYGPCMPLAACVQRGLLLTVVTPSRVVALGERAADGR